MQMRSMIKTSHNIGKFLKSALKRDQIDEGAMAEDLGVTRPSIANHTGKYNAPIDMAAKYSTKATVALFFGLCKHFNSSLTFLSYSPIPFDFTRLVTY